MSEHELKLLGGKAKLWMILHPDVSAYCMLCPHLNDIKWCWENPRCLYDKETRITRIETRRLVFGWTCIEWAKYV